MRRSRMTNTSIDKAEQPSTLVTEHPKDGILRILSLDGGGAKGFYTLGVLREIEGLIGCKFHERFDLIFGTSTGAIIAALLGLGKTIKEISSLYEEHVPTVMSKKNRHDKSQALAVLAD